jgi:predicted RNase H-like HicB family nuclease
MRVIKVGGSAMSPAAVESLSPNSTPAVTPPATPSSGKVDWHVVLQTLADGQFVAWITEWPDCRVTAGGREEALAALKQSLGEKMKSSEVIPLSVSLSDSATAENPWERFYGVLKDDPGFIQWADDFWAEKQRSHDDDEVLSVEECLRVL